MYSNVAESLKSIGILPKQRSTQPRTRDQANHFYSVTTTHLFATSKTPFEAENEKYIYVGMQYILRYIYIIFSGMWSFLIKSNLFEYFDFVFHILFMYMILQLKQITSVGKVCNFSLQEKKSGFFLS